MAEQTEIELYNYRDFISSDFLPFRTHLPVGSAAPDCQLILLGKNHSVQLSDYWKENDLVVEFGSLTWPYCALAAPALEPMAREYVNRGFAFLFLYTREAHPGENFPAHRSMEQKLAHAYAFQERYHIERPILVDDLVGTGHKLYGMLPNMTYVVGRGGKILFRADWTDPPTIQWTVQYIQSSRARLREGFHMAPFYAEIVGYRWNSPIKVMEGLRRAGPKAVEDYERAMEHRKKQGPVPGRIKIDD